ncbi:hypothetical protein Hdeb2414_s0022g00619961 [Helianthus debilis subsp. tardiflorus]
MGQALCGMYDWAAPQSYGARRNKLELKAQTVYPIVLAVHLLGLGLPFLFV